MANQEDYTNEEIQTALEEGYIDMLKTRVKQLKAALNEIENITAGLTEFNPTYERIYNIARKAQEVPK